MTPNPSRRPIRALTLALVVVCIAFATTTPLAGTAAAAANSETLTVTDDPVQPDGTITVEGNIGSTGTGDDVTFLIQDPVDSDVATVSADVDSTDFSTTIDLRTLDFGDGLDAGTATIMADEGGEFVSPEASTTFDVDDTYPTVSIDTPSDGGELTSAPTVSGTASDDTELGSVEVRITNSDGQYYNGSAWVADAQWLDTTGSPSDWEYDTDGEGITADGEYDVAVRATDAAGHTRSYTAGPPTPSSDTLQVGYTVDTEAPSISDQTVSDPDSDGTVAVGETVTVSATVTDGPAGVDTVEVNASALGGSDTLTLTADSGNSYRGTFTVSDPAVGDGSVSLPFNATDAFGQSATASDTVTLETEIASVDELTVTQNFAGVVADENTSVRVTAQGVSDAQGNQVSDESGTLSIAGTTYDVTVSDGAIDARIDPTAIPDDTSTGETTVSLVEADADSATDTVNLVHEARDLESGYQVSGTPMDAQDVVFQDVSDVITYDPTSSEQPWVAPSETQAGEGYYVYGESSAARIGYTYAETGQLRSEYLHQGYNLVAATPDLNDGDTVQVGSDLGSSLSVDGNPNVQVYVRNPDVSLTDPSGTTDVAAFSEVDGTTEVGGYEGYFVYVDAGDAVHVVGAADYEPGEGS